jgi:hypothetical protein
VEANSTGGQGSRRAVAPSDDDRPGDMDRNSSVGTSTRYVLDGLALHPGGVDIFRTRPDRPWIPLSLLYSAYSFPG